MDVYSQTLVVSDQIVLRPLQASDASAIAAGLSDWAVTQWLTHVPFPYGLSDAVAFLASDVSRGALAIVVDGRFAGAAHIGDNHMLGYWLSRAFHGQGIMTRVTQAMIAAHFAQSDATLISGYHIGNQASRNVLTKQGFRVTGHSLERTARGDSVVLRRMALRRRTNAGFPSVSLPPMGSLDG
jgi:RimJ/RimL family protein N-acetyltransferase